jgi:glycosyltransferase involved in cell wall biosynthesis
MRIVMIAPFAMYPKGTFQIRMLPIAKRLHKNGHDVLIVVPPYDNISQSGLAYEIDGVQVQNIIFTDISVLKYFLALLRIVKKTIAFKPDVIYFFKPKGYSGLAAMFMSTMRHLGLLGKQIRLILDTDDWEGYGGFCDLYMKYSIYPKHILDFFDFQERWIPKRMDAITVASLALKEQMLMNDIPLKKIFYVPNGVSEQPRYVSNDGEVLKLRTNLGLSSNSQTILLYTRFFEYEIRQFVSIVKLVSDKISDVKFIVVGKGEFREEEKLKKLLASERLERFVTVVGWVDYKEIPKYLALADVAIYPFDDTLLNRSKCPGKLIELMEAGKPIVAHGVGQIREYIENEISGILVQSNDDYNFSAQILRLLNDNSLRKKLSHNAKMQITTRFSWDDLIRTVEQALIDRS